MSPSSDGGSGGSGDFVARKLGVLKVNVVHGTTPLAHVTISLTGGDSSVTVGWAGCHFGSGKRG